MKPLGAREIKALNLRIDNATGGELRSLLVIDPLTMQLRLSVQDASRGHDWIDVIFEISGVSDARLIEDAKLAFLDMETGMTLLSEGDEAVVAVGRYSSLHSALDAPLYIKGTALKFEEAPFSG